MSVHMRFVLINPPTHPAYAFLPCKKMGNVHNIFFYIAIRIYVCMYVCICVWVWVWVLVCVCVCVWCVYCVL